MATVVLLLIIITQFSPLNVYKQHCNLFEIQYTIVLLNVACIELIHGVIQAIFMQDVNTSQGWDNSSVRNFQATESE